MSELAIVGGAPVRTRPIPAWPSFDERTIEAATDVLRSGKVNYWTGTVGRSFEEEFAQQVGRRYAVAVANGTVALELCLRAVGVGPGDDVIVPSRTFVASASAVVMAGARPVMADVDAQNQNLSAATVEACLTPRTRAIIAVHLGGWPCETTALMALARRQRLVVIEDCAQAHGGAYRGRSVGALGDLAAFSFCQDKILTTGGEGGMLVTDDEDIYKLAWALKDHGKDYDAVFTQAHPPGFRWLHRFFGTNWRMTEMQAALGRAQLGRVVAWIAARQSNARVLRNALGAHPALSLTSPPPDVSHAYYRFYVFVKPETLAPGWTRDRVLAAISAEGVPCSTGSCGEIYLERAFGADLRPPERLAVARRLGETSLAFPVHPTLATEDLHDIANATHKVLQAACAR